jgi:tetratricopeptide (TPR) repeat protein
MDAIKRTQKLIQINFARIEKRYEDAIDICFEYLRNFGENIDVISIAILTYLELDLSQIRRKNIGFKLLQWLDKAILLHPDSFNLYVLRGSIFFLGIEAPDYEKAAKDYRFALELEPNSIEANLGLASLEGVPEKVVSLEEAIKALEKVARVQPNNPQLFLYLGALLKKAGEYSYSRQIFAKALLCKTPLPINQVDIIEKELIK